ncbi:uncharacterized protein LOC141530712 isoform X2 [Cotesia typhae]|uniref:uncharacterized protein LOC141530712 isoform X2 n=1 Tax=Cotesia typhae TaxID=2053667 RepID=UPI003D687991
MIQVIESSRLKSLADEVGDVFNEEPGLYFTPYTQEGHISVNANGKLWDRYNYTKKQLRNAGILKPVQNTSIEAESPVTITVSDSQEIEKLEFLKNNLEPWNLIFQYWNETYTTRKNFLKTYDLSLLTTYRCLHQQNGVLLLFPEKLNAINSFWPTVEQFIEQYIELDPQLKDNSEAQDVITLIPSLSGNEKQVVLLILLGLMLKPTKIKHPTSKTPKKRKLNESLTQKPANESIESLESSAINDFIVRVEVEAKINEIIDHKKTIAVKKKIKIQPYMIFVGSSSKYESFYVITDIIKYKVNNPLEALQLNFELFYTFDWKYPQSCYNIWVFIQKKFFGIPVPGNHYCAKMKKMLGYITRTMKIQIN